MDETINHVGRDGDAVEYQYLVGHRRRLAISPTFVPKAETADALCLDVELAKRAVGRTCCYSLALPEPFAIAVPVRVT